MFFGTLLACNKILCLLINCCLDYKEVDGKIKLPEYVGSDI